MPKLNLERRREVAEWFRVSRGGHSDHSRWGKTRIRYNGATRVKQACAVLTIPAKLSVKIADAFERGQLYTCEVTDDGRIIFTPELPPCRNDTDGDGNCPSCAHGQKNPLCRQW